MNTTLSDPSHKPLFPRGPGLGLKFAFFALLSVALLVADGRESQSLAPIRQWTSWALTPVLWFADMPEAMSGGVDHLQSRETLLTENRELKKNQLEQEARLLRLASLESENQRIRELLGSASALSDRSLIAEILATSEDPYRDQIVLNKGSRDGVYRGQALVDAAGVMGQVVQVNPTSCIALLITDPDHGIPVEINRTGLQTIAHGRGDGQGLSLPYLPGNADVKVGDLLVSSGLGGRFPAGYPVGEVYELRHAGGESFMEAVAYPRAKLHQGRQALLVWSERASPSATDEPLPEVPIDLPIKNPATATKKNSPHPAPAVPRSSAAPAQAAGEKPATAPAAVPAHKPAAGITAPAGTPATTKPAPKPTPEGPTARPLQPKPATAKPKKTPPKMVVPQEGPAPAPPAKPMVGPPQ